MDNKLRNELDIIGRGLAIVNSVLDDSISMDDILSKPAETYIKAYLQAHHKIPTRSYLDWRITQLFGCFESTGMPMHQIQGEEVAVVHAAYTEERELLSKTIAERIRNGREKLGLTQSELAERADIAGGKVTISRYESGENKPSITALFKIRNVLGIRNI